MSEEKAEENKVKAIFETVKKIAGIYIELEDERLTIIVSGAVAELEGMGVQIRTPISIDYFHYCRVVHDMAMPVFYNNHNQTQKFQKNLSRDINTLKISDNLGESE